MALSLSRLFAEFVLKKIFKFMVFTLLENALNLGISTHAPLPLKSRPQALIITPKEEESYFFPQ